MAPSRMVQKQRPTKRPQKLSDQRPDLRGNPDFTGEPWGSSEWPNDDADVAANLTQEVFGSYVNVAPFDDLATLQADAVYGDGNLSYGGGANFASTEYVVLQDNSLAHYNTSAWVVGAAP